MKRGTVRGLLVLGIVVSTVGLGPAAASADMGSNGRDFGEHVVTCAQEEGFGATHHPGMHQGYAGWHDAHHDMC